MSHGSSEEENYWPGYVDALTSMVQVLAFVMMLLAMAVFVLSQSVSKSAVQAIAKAAGLDVPSDANVNQLTATVIDELKRAQGKATKPFGISTVESPSGAIVDPADPLPTKKNDAGSTPDSSPQAHGSDDTGGSGSALTEAIAHSTAAATNSGSHTLPARISTAHANRVLNLHFEPHGFKIDDQEQNDTDQFVQSEKMLDSSRLVSIRAYALASTGALSEARRVAYYRAMVVRKRLTDNKIQPTRIRIVLLDTQDAAQGSSVDVFMSDDDGKP